MNTDTFLVLGGAASGKSDFAEALVRSLGAEWQYIATAQALDAEMAAKIRRHADRRGPGWTLVEAPLDPGAALTGRRPILLDCATMWLSNVMFAAETDGVPLPEAEARLLAAISACPAPLVIVTNEVGQGIVPGDALSRHFREAQGRLNIALARQCATVVQVIAGLPNVLKGALPDGVAP